MALYIKQLFGTDGFVILTEGKNLGHLTRLDDKGAFPREYAAKFAAVDELLAAIDAVLSAETYALHVGYGNATGGGNYLYADAVRLDDEAFDRLRKALATARNPQERSEG